MPISDYVDDDSLGDCAGLSAGPIGVWPAKMVVAKEEEPADWDDYGVSDGEAAGGEASARQVGGSGHHLPPPTARNAAILRAATERAIRQSSSTRAARPRAPPFGVSTLLGPRGFRRLRQAAAKLPPSDPANPAQGLDRLMILYRDWVHQMYPKFVFADVIDKTERICRTAPMKVGITAWDRHGCPSSRDLFHGRRI